MQYYSNIIIINIILSLLHESRSDAKCWICIHKNCSELEASYGHTGWEAVTNEAEFDVRNLFSVVMKWTPDFLPSFISLNTNIDN